LADSRPAEQRCSFCHGVQMSNTTQHHLTKFLATPSKPMKCPAGEEPAYDPNSQLQIQWVDIEDHMDVLCSGERTGDPDTLSSTTAPPDRRYPGDADTDDSGT
jgi:hypothetical protein